MSTVPQKVYETVQKNDPLNFWTEQGPDFKKITETLELDNNFLSKVSGLSKNSVRKSSRVPKQLADRLVEIANVCSIVAEYFNGDIYKTALWFKTRNPMLGGISPRDMIHRGRYHKLLEFVLEARESNDEKNKRKE